MRGKSPPFPNSQNPTPLSPEKRRPKPLHPLSLPLKHKIIYLSASPTPTPNSRIVSYRTDHVRFPGLEPGIGHHIRKRRMRPIEPAIRRRVDLDKLRARLLPHLRRSNGGCETLRGPPARASDGGGSGENRSRSGGAVVVGPGLAAQEIGAVGVVVHVDGIGHGGCDAAEIATGATTRGTVATETDDGHEGKDNTEKKTWKETRDDGYGWEFFAVSMFSPVLRDNL